MNWDELFSNKADCTPGEKVALPRGGGVYLLTDVDDRFVQLASAADLRRAVHHRLEPPKVAADDKSGSPESGNVEPVDPPAGPLPTETACERVWDRLPAGHSDPQDAGPTQAAAPRRVASHTRSEAPGPARPKVDLSQVVRRVRWESTCSAFEAMYAYHRIARIVLPDTYRKNVAFGPSWFVHCDAAAAIPRFSTVKIIPSVGGTTLGPFATQQDANRFVQILEDVFGLCRYVHILEQAPHGEPCAYFEMGRCPAPCNASIPMSQYRETIASALRFALGRRQAAEQQWQRQMQDASGRLEFEKAAAIKQRIDRAGELDHAAFRLVRPLGRFSWLIVQRGPGRTRAKPFFVHQGWIEPGPTVMLKKLDAVVDAWITQARPTPSSDEAPTTSHGPSPSLPAAEGSLEREHRSEQIWLVSHFLFSRQPAGLFIDAGQLPTGEALAAMIRERFAPARKQSADGQET